MIEPPRIGFGPHGARGDECLDLGCEVDGVPLTRPEQRTDADAISPENDDAADEIDQGERELPFQIGKQTLPILLVEMDEDFAVAVGAEHVPLGFEVRPAFGIIEELAVADDGDGAVFVEDGLLAVLESDDAEAAMRKIRRRAR